MRLEGSKGREENFAPGGGVIGIGLSFESGGTLGFDEELAERGKASDCYGYM